MKDCLVCDFGVCDWDCVLDRFWFVVEVEEVEELLWHLLVPCCMYTRYGGGAYRLLPPEL